MTPAKLLTFMAALRAKHGDWARELVIVVAYTRCEECGRYYREPARSRCALADHIEAHEALQAAAREAEL